MPSAKFSMKTPATDPSLEELNQTPVPSDAPELPQRPAPPLGALFAQKDRLVRLALGVTLVSLVSGVLSLVTMMSSSGQETRFVVVDTSGNIFVVPGRAFDEAKELHTQQALLATSVLLLRNPSDFDLPELLQSLFSSRALFEAASIRNAETPEFQAKQIHQKPNVSRIEALELRPNAVRLQVSGQVVRNGLFQNQPFVETLPFTLELVMQHNTDLLRNKRQPMLVTQCALRYEAR